MFKKQFWKLYLKDGLNGYFAWKIFFLLIACAVVSLIDKSPSGCIPFSIAYILTEPFVYYLFNYKK